MQASSNQNYNKCLQKNKCHTSNPKSSTPFSLLNLNTISTLLSSITILPPNYLYLQNFLPHPKNSFLSTLPLLDSLPLNSLVLLLSQEGKRLFFLFLGLGTNTPNCLFLFTPIFSHQPIQCTFY